MKKQHIQEKIIETFDYNGVAVDLVYWEDTVWCGKIGYADNNTDEPNVDKIANDFMPLNNVAVNEREKDWDVCISVNYLSSERPNGVMFGFLVATEKQPESFDIYKVPATDFLRIRICDETAKALGCEPWKGGIPPYEWIGERIAPEFGYKYGDDRLPIIEYYGYYNPTKNSHEYCYLYVPVEKV